MGELFWNKIAGAVLATFLVLFAINEAGHFVFHAHELEEAAYPIEVSDTPTNGAVEEGPVDFGLLLASASVDGGERVFRQCATCHNIAEGAGALTGPNLWDIVGGPVASVPGFAYSQALREFGGEWTYERLYDYLENPRRYIRGTNMSFAGLSRQEQRIDVIAYLRAQAGELEPLPQPLPAVEDAVDDTVEATAVDASAEAEAVVDDVIENAADAAEPLVDAVEDAIEDAAGEVSPTEDAQPADAPGEVPAEDAQPEDG